MDVHLLVMSNYFWHLDRKLKVLWRGSAQADKGSFGHLRIPFLVKDSVKFGCAEILRVELEEPCLIVRVEYSYPSSLFYWIVIFPTRAAN